MAALRRPGRDHGHQADHSTASEGLGGSTVGEGRWSQAAGLESLALRELHLAMTSDWAATRKLEVEGPAGWLPKWKEMGQSKRLREKQQNSMTIPM